MMMTYYLDLVRSWAKFVRDKGVIKKGSIGKNVRAAQILLTNAGFVTPGTDEFDSLTKNATMAFQSSALGPDGEYLVPDGIIGPKTAWALSFPDSSTQSHEIETCDIVLNESTPEYRWLIVNKAMSYHNEQESPIGSNRGKIIDRWTNRLGFDRQTKGPPWCAYFASAMIYEVNGKYPWEEELGLRRLQSAYKFLEMSKSMGWWRVNDGKYLPRPGDLYVIQYREKDGSRTYSGHIGFCLTMEKGSMRGNTISGNEDNRVKFGIRDFSKKTYGDNYLTMGFINMFDDDNRVAPSFGLVGRNSSDESQTR